MSKNLKGNLILFFTAIVWGISFVSQSVGMDFIGPNTFNGIRCLLGSVVLIPVILIKDKKSGEKLTKQGCKTLIIGGIVCGILLCLASTLQTIGIKYTTTAKSGFITAMYIILVPFVSIFFKKKVGIITYLGALIAVLGLYLLCMPQGGDTSVNIGDILTLLCAVVFTFHILAIDHFSPRTDGVKLASMQFFVTGVINIILMFIFENPDIKIIKSCIGAIIYSGVMSCGVGYTLQIIGQKYTDPTPAAIIMSFEAVFAALAGFVILGEELRLIQVLGCAIMFAAILIVQLPNDFLKSKKNK